MNNNQKIKGNNNTQIGINNGTIIQTKKIRFNTVVQHDPSLHISEQEAFSIREKINELAKMMAASDTRNTYSIEQYAFKKKFQITSYKLLPKDRYEEAMVWLQKRIAAFGKKSLKKGNPAQWRTEQYKAIYAKSNSLGWDKYRLYEFAEEVLNLKIKLSSLTDLSDTRLQKLYNAIFTIRK